MNRVEAAITADIHKQIKQVEMLRREIRYLTREKIEMGHEIDRLKRLSSRAYELILAGIDSRNKRTFWRAVKAAKRTLEGIL